MGDFNGFFKNEEPLNVWDKNFQQLKKETPLPLSCCYNFNSSCPENMRSGEFRRIFNESRGSGKMNNNSSFNKLKITPGLQYLIGTKST